METRALNVCWSGSPPEYKEDSEEDETPIQTWEAEYEQGDHAIELVPGSEPKPSKVYPLSLVEQKELDSFLEENLCTGQICLSKSPMAAPVFFIKKKNGLLWLVSQMATYWFVIGGLDIQKAQKSEVRQAAKDVVKSEV